MGSAISLIRASVYGRNRTSWRKDVFKVGDARLRKWAAWGFFVVALLSYSPYYAKADISDDAKEEALSVTRVVNSVLYCNLFVAQHKLPKIIDLIIDYTGFFERKYGEGLDDVLGGYDRREEISSDISKSIIAWARGKSKLELVSWCRSIGREVNANFFGDPMELIPQKVAETESYMLALRSALLSNCQYETDKNDWRRYQIKQGNEEQRFWQKYGKHYLFISSIEYSIKLYERAKDEADTSLIQANKSKREACRAQLGKTF
jgi:hypothetical protein